MMQVILIALIVTYVNAQCTFDGIDFSPLTNSATDWTGQDPLVPSYYYRFNVCRNTVLTYSGSSCPTGYAAYQLGTATGTSPCYANCGSWGTPTWEKIDNGYSLKYGNGRVCSGNPGTFTVIFTCASGGPVVPTPSPYFSVTEKGQCQYEVTMPTSLACKGSGGGSDDEGGLSGGSVFLIIFFVGGFVYLAGGMFYNTKQKGLSGTDAIPNIEFWRELPTYVKDGISFTKEKLCSGGSGGSSYTSA